MAPSMAPSITEPTAKGPSVSYAEQVAAAKALAATSLDGALQNLLSYEKTARLVCPPPSLPLPILSPSLSLPRSLSLSLPPSPHPIFLGARALPHALARLPCTSDAVADGVHSQTIAVPFQPVALCLSLCPSPPFSADDRGRCRDVLRSQPARTNSLAGADARTRSRMDAGRRCGRHN